MKFTINKVSPIRDEDEYGGFRFKLDVRFENLKSTISVDIATGDPITPSEIDYNYKCILTGEEFLFKSYNLETILAEKLQTIFTRGLANSRSKDYYDIYIIYKLKREQINFEHLKAAFAKTCKYRNTLFSNEEINSMIKAIEINRILGDRWKTYSKKMKFANEITYHEIMESLRVISKYLMETKELLSV